MTTSSLLRSTIHSRRSRLLFTAAAFLAVFLNSPSSAPSPTGGRHPGPSAEEARVLDNLARWVVGERAQVELARAVRDHDRSFELFRTFAAAEVRRGLLSELPFGELIWRSGQRWGVDPLLLAAIVETESRFDPQAVSSQGALGLMQVLPETADLYRPAADALDPAINLEVGTRYLRGQLLQFEGDLPLALAAYNAGPGNVLRFGGIPPFAETNAYVRRVLTHYVRLVRLTWQSTGELDWLVIET